MRTNRIVMLGPHLKGAGGISKVASIWKANGIFDEHGIVYIPTTPDTPSKSKVCKLLSTIRSLLLFGLVVNRSRLTYIHSAVDTSFYRKSLFLYISILFNIPVLLHIHPAAFIDFIRRSGKTGRKYIFFLLRRVGHIIVLTNDMRKQLQSIVPDKNIFVLRNPVDMEEMDREPIPRAENQLLYLGWYEKEKGVYDLVDAIEILSHKGIAVRADYYGTVGTHQLREYVNSKKLGHVVSVNDWITGRAKIDALYSSTALVLPSYTEGIPNVILEAMATRTPIISTLVGGLKEILRDRENAIVVEPGNPKDLSEKIIECLRNTALRNTIAQNAYYEAKAKYDVPVIKEQFNSIMQKVLHG